MKPTFKMVGGSLVERAIFVATMAHLGQVDKAGNPYILHPLRVMGTQIKPELQIVAVLHDVIEDTDVNFHDIAEEFGLDVANKVSNLTWRDDQSRKAYIKNISLRPELLNIKLRDMEDNLSLFRLSCLPKQTQEKLRRKYKSDLLYLKSLGCTMGLIYRLLDRLSKGNN